MYLPFTCILPSHLLHILAQLLKLSALKAPTYHLWISWIWCSFHDSVHSAAARP